MGKSIVLCVIALLWFNIGFGQEAVPAERNFKLFHFGADLAYSPLSKTLKGSVSYDVSPLRSSTDSLVFFCPGMKISSVSMVTFAGLKNTVPLTFAQQGDKLVIFPKSSLDYGVSGDPRYKITIVYTAIAPPELHQTGWDDPTARMRKQVWAHRPFGWIPYTDQMTTQDIRITFNKDYKVVSNGERLETIPSGDSALTWHYRLDKPHPFYSVCFVAGDYSYKSMKTKRGVPLELWYYPEYEDRFALTYKYQAAMFDFLEKETGLNYPYALYRNIPVADYLYGAMETTTSTVYADFLQVDQRGFLGRNYVNTNAHELAHQWFGNCINDKTVDDLWLTESFATYYAKAFEQAYLGEEAYLYQRDLEMQKALKIAESNDFPLGSGKAGVERWYQKGSLVMDMLRDWVGDAGFQASVSNYMNTNKYGEAESNDFLKAIYNTTGYAMDGFFADWVYNGGEPEYKIDWKQITNTAGQGYTQISVAQVQRISKPEELFRMPVNIEVYYTDGSMTMQKVWVENAFTLAEIPAEPGKTTAFVVFDAGNRILKKMQFARSFEELSQQLKQAKQVPDRLEALRAMQKLPQSQKREALSTCIRNEHFFLIRAEVVSQLCHDSLSIDLLQAAIQDPQVLVRKAVVDNVKVVPPLLIPAYESLLKDSSYAIVELALLNLCNTANAKGAFSKTEDYLKQTQTEVGWRGRNIHTAWLGIALERQPDNKVYLSELTDYTGPSYDFETRLNALNQFKKLNYLDEKVAANLVTASKYWNYKLATPAKEMISYFMQQDRYSLLLEKMK